MKSKSNYNPVVVPTRPIESSVRSPVQQYPKISSKQTNVPQYQMRDLYDRQKKLIDWLRRVKEEVEDPDRTDILKLVEFMQDRERSILWIVRCITALVTIRRQLGKPFRNTTKEDIRLLLKWMELKGYKASTNEKFRQVLKLFYKIVYGDNEYYPEQVKWFSSKVGKEKTGKKSNMDMAEYLEEEEVKKLIESAPTLQNKAFLACMYESGARPEEFLRLTNSDMRVDSKGAVLMLRGKTGERRVRIISFSKLLQQWLDIHPLKYQDCYPLWVSEASNYKHEPLGIRGAEKIIVTSVGRSGLVNKHARLYALRHSRATHLAKYLTEAQMCTFFGWVLGTKVVGRYVHLSGKDVDDALFAINETSPVKREEYKLKSLKCKRCSESFSPGMNFCPKCALPINVNDQYTIEMELEQENKELKKKYEQDIEILRNEMNNKFIEVMSMIRQNPQLAYIKPEALKEKIKA